MKHEELRKLAEAATQGEWHWDGNVCDYDPLNEAPWLVSGDIHPPVLSGTITCSRPDDAAYIAAANPAAILALLDELEAARRDAERLDWLDSQRYGYGFEEMHEGNRWTIDGPFANVRIAIDEAMEAK